MKIVQVVRRFGRVGGMESYVWNLTSELSKCGYKITVICERCLDEVPEGVVLVEIGEVTPRPRWLALYRFSAKVQRLLKSGTYQDSLIHSHERLGVHHITTFHGPPFARIKDGPLWNRLSLRVLAHLYLERRELLSDNVRAVVPNSALIARELVVYYPGVYGRLYQPIPPGVGVIPKRPQRAVDPSGGVVGFVGKEWKRKGLNFTLEVLDRLAITRPNIELLILGPNSEDIRELIVPYGFKIKLIGWESAAPYYQNMDLLIHPAKREPYGMVVAEAMAAGVPVLVSDKCGVASDVSETAGCVLSLDLNPSDWSSVAHRLLSRTATFTHVRSWADVAADYSKIFEDLKLSG